MQASTPPLTFNTQNNNKTVIKNYHSHSYSSPSQRKRVIEQNLGSYMKKLKLSNKKVLKPSEDRLSQLTTKQIDRLIDMQKIKSLLNDNKKGYQPVHISFKQQHGKHPNVYQPNFIAKINQIAIERNIRHLKSQQFDKQVDSPQRLRQRELRQQKKNLRFVKEYKIDTKKEIKISYEDSLQKSIDSIESNLEEFEECLKIKKGGRKLDQSIAKLKHKQTNILSMTRWFNGMSTFYLNLNENEKKHFSAEGRPHTSKTFMNLDEKNQTKTTFRTTKHSRQSTVY